MLIFFKWFLGAMLLALVTAQSNTIPVTGLLGNATETENNPKGVTYTAHLPDKEFFEPGNPHDSIKGQVSATSGPNGDGVTFDVSFSNLPTSGGPFLYHLHEHPVPSDGNCTGTLGHVDPFERGEVPACDSQLPETCQVGDLAGKYGPIISDPFKASYTDEYASTLAGSRAFFGNGSITLHFANLTRITCANFTLVKSTPPVGSNHSSNATSTTTSSPTSSPTGTPMAPPTSKPTNTSVSSTNMVPIVTLFTLLAAALMM